MAEFVANAPQNVALNSPIVFNASIPCNTGNVFHEDESGIFILKGRTNNCFARFQVTFNGNVSVPEGGELTPVAVAISVCGEPRLTSRAIFTPQAVDEYGNLTSTALITVPRGCCFNVSVDYVDATTDDPATEPTPVITVQNANLVVTRVA